MESRRDSDHDRQVADEHRERLPRWIAFEDATFLSGWSPADLVALARLGTVRARLSEPEPGDIEGLLRTKDLVRNGLFNPRQLAASNTPSPLVVCAGVTKAFMRLTTRAVAMAVAVFLVAHSGTVYAAPGHVKERAVISGKLMNAGGALTVLPDSPTPSPAPSPTRSPGPRPAPGSSAPCAGVQVSAGANLTTVAAAAPSGTTFCLAAGNYTVAEKIISQPGDVFSGQGPASTIITAAPGCCTPMFDYYGGASGVVTFVHLAVGGANTPITSHCTSGSCGSVMLSTVVVHMNDVRCFGNATTCLSGGTHDTVLSNFECDGNGWHPDSLANAFQSSSCIKMSHGSLTVTNSNFHDNTWDAIWCDFCDQTFLNVQSSRFIHNGRAGITWEVSGDTVAGDHALVQGNVFSDNGWNPNTPNGSGGHAGIIISDASNMEIAGNTFGGNLALDSVGTRAVLIYDGPRDPAPIHGIFIHNNTLNGDRIHSCTATGVRCRNNSTH